MGTLTYPHTLTAGTPENVGDVQENFDAVASVLNGSVDSANIASGVLEDAGVSSSSSVRRGATNIATSQSRTNTAYGALTTPDQVATVVLPADGLLVVGYQATWQQSNASAASAAIFLGSDQLKVAVGSGAPVVQGSTIGATTGSDAVLATTGLGLLTGPVGHTGDITTGQILGAGPCYIFAAAGTYTVSVQFKASAGSVTVKDRHLWVWTMGF